MLEKLKDFGAARLIILAFLMLLIFFAYVAEMQLTQLAGDSLARVARNGVLVLALLPGVRGGIGLNFGLPLGILCGLMGMIVSMEYDWTGAGGFFGALGLAVFLATIAGWLYGKLLNKVKGQEMMVGTYVGFAFVSLMCIFWLVLPFRNYQLIWAIGGKGLRTTSSLQGYYLNILDNFLSFKIGPIAIPTGSLLFFALCCFVVSLFFRTRTGMAIAAAGGNETFARASGVNPQKTRVQATMISTILAAIGILVYNQSFGFVQVYNAPLLMAFPVIACLLIGGASVNQASIFHVVFGAIVFQTILTVALPVASEFISGDLSETARIIISNGIILYALTGIKKK